MLFAKISRKEAYAGGFKRFYTGKLCSRGHDAQRFVSTGGCTKCNAERAKAFRTGADTVSSAVQQGAFLHMLHPDDHEAARAYCQALDMQRGRTPWSPPERRAAPAVPFDVEAARARAFGLAAKL